MKFFISFLNTFLPLLYFITTFLYALYFHRDEPWASKWMKKLLRITLVAHFTFILVRGFYLFHFPMASIFEAFTVLAFSIALIYTYIEFRTHEPNTGYIILVVVFFFQLISSAFIDFTGGIPEILHNPLFIFHTSFALLGYSALAISALYSLMYLMLFYEIKKNRFGVLFNRLPSLEVLSEMDYRAVKVGFVFLTIAIILGSFWSNILFHSFFHIDPKIIIVILTWVLYAILLVGHKTSIMSRKQQAFLSIAAFTILIFSIVAVNTFLHSFHKFN